MGSPAFNGPAVRLIEAEIAARVGSADWWSRLNARIDGHIARGEQHEAAIDATLERMRADHEAERTFIERWNSMTYAEAVVFMRGPRS